MLRRLCSRCAAWGVWGRPGTGLGMFLGALGGTGLLYQLQSYVEPDEDERWTDREVREAAGLLRTEQDSDPDDEVEGGISRQEVREDAEELRGLIFAHWRGAGRSLHRAQAALAHFPWLGEWAKPSLTVKMRYLETFRAQAARSVDPEELVVAAAATALPMPELPHADPAFAVLGGNSRVSRALVDLFTGGRARPGGPGKGRGRVRTSRTRSCEAFAAIGRATTRPEPRQRA